MKGKHQSQEKEKTEILDFFFTSIHVDHENKLNFLHSIVVQKSISYCSLIEFKRFIYFVWKLRQASYSLKFCFESLQDARFPNMKTSQMQIFMHLKITN